MPNERLRAALLERGLTPSKLGDEIGVDHKTVERWITLGRTPYRRHRYAVAARLAVDESYLWPEALSREQVTAASDSEVLAIYPHRSDVPDEVWERLFSAAEQEIGILAYAGLSAAWTLQAGERLDLALAVAGYAAGQLMTHGRSDV